eukprot:Gregarina_sp_Pseudo_9__617@NODE_1396_length_1637_cov_62_710263_g1301_i0_p1_GENE_NODE_1396_length_1637_cov_62_710263_g1301_i0NODE_1396_length_1637_cov_62_710263_g1301_i0_p1_ORF_typecomplete_len396_score68_60IIGP/PF05049_13/1_8e03IIGP/PF05049_13/9_4e53HOOK/PF05622_12/1e10MMR_HSR1/PF01926_23/5_8e02MMR_HSR1/PF01926_23/2_3e08FeoB_N/PF02421_18/1_2e08RsgA_GTPase/PF03193_16/2_1e05RsgA_GTPase/PF03193_16/3_1e02SRPRB/PF09439_10/0_00012Septin/PF00735_18/4_3e02Septin/PF00735_18/0_00011Roc/PF08477_13/1_5e03Ro
MGGLFSKGADEEKKRLDERIKKATAENEQRKADLAAMQAKMEALNREKATHSVANMKALTEQKAQMSQLQARIEALNREKTLQQQASTKAVDEQRSQMSQMQAKMDALRQQIANQASVRDQLEGAVKAMTAQIAQLQEAMKRGIDAEFAPTNRDIFVAKRKLGYREGYFHIAIAGRSGTGKSSLINSLRGLRKNDPGAAAVGYVETTTQTTSYEPPNARYKVRWYDVPGAGTLNIPRWDYFKNHDLFMFDAIILVWDSRLMDTDFAILMHCSNLQIPCFVVRSKCDFVLANARRDIEDELREQAIFPSDDQFYPEFNTRFEQAVAQLRVTTQQNFNEQCSKEKLPPREMYLVSERGVLHTFRFLESNSDYRRDEVELLDEEKFLHALMQWVQARQ